MCEMCISILAVLKQMLVIKVKVHCSVASSGDCFSKQKHSVLNKKNLILDYMFKWNVFDFGQINTVFMQ